jgi:hypothetical protein
MLILPVCHVGNVWWFYDHPIEDISMRECYLIVTFLTNASTTSMIFCLTSRAMILSYTRTADDRCKDRQPAYVRSTITLEPGMRPGGDDPRHMHVNPCID